MNAVVVKHATKVRPGDQMLVGLTHPYFATVTATRRDLALGAPVEITTKNPDLLTTSVAIVGIESYVLVLDSEVA